MNLLPEPLLLSHDAHGQNESIIVMSRVHAPTPRFSWTKSVSHEIWVAGSHL